MSISLAEAAKEKGIRYFLISFTDLFGVVRSKLVPAAAIAGMQKNGAGFAGFAAYLDMTPADSDMFGLPDADRLIQLPWKPEVGWLPSDIYLGGKIVAHGPRTVLKQVLADAGEKGFQVKTGVECEYFILNPEGTAVADSADIQPKPCYDQQALMRRYDLISEICDHMETLGWGPYQNDHEDANGQFEMNWDYTEALTTADRHSFFKYMTKTVAERHGFRATFMPKPIATLTGNGCHAHVSVWKKTGKINLMEDKKGELGLSKLAYHFIGGLLEHAESLAAITNPVVNSYKRINAPRTTSGATWSPNTVTYSGNNRTHMIRIPDSDRIEVRLADGAANPYLLQAVLIGAGLWGVANKIDPGKRLDIDMYAEGHKVKNAPKLPLNLLDALRAFQNNKIMRGILGAEFADSYLKLKMEEWNSYMQHFSEWERQNALDV
ncbi:MAG: type III glutamate--ammonia ligase [SAR324 cluster bacterium]|jgi:glutamine synthetase|nr:type III glutamate--ammonia ligase [Deltaproteobacteria bacterium]MDP7606566.1 type III glutamate--ammonia ligase [SAR324 cluster bacterium]MEC9219503.1 type III glutamate--ammonia ligase [SAR324 cluster bacterium]